MVDSGALAYRLGLLEYEVVRGDLVGSCSIGAILAIQRLMHHPLTDRNGIRDLEHHCAKNERHDVQHGFESKYGQCYQARGILAAEDKTPTTAVKEKQKPAT